ncbi:MAG: UDP-N-acetylglucosamine 2-epimerase (non-hydrolyzing) [Methanomicrobiales archaeon]|nr:UDP-N-acetylglucosamine 2-epimerase (non-hydrolyzing) [Methanomicrobiales archaeon]MDD1668457.1 UDP-N-acetylglucosamine 2-epimerase (non-hydrolyzing) [Methanomicrobiales archaeon]
MRELKRRGGDPLFIHSGQHYDYEMDRIFFDEMHLPDPTHYLGVGSKLPGEQLGEMIARSEQVFIASKPDLLLVTGDTNTGLGVALAAAKAKVPVAHMEAGMRSFDRSMPEEINRIVIDHISEFLFSPTRRGVENLRAGGITENVWLSGDVMLDSILGYRGPIGKRPETLDTLGLGVGEFLLLTLHREANTDRRDRLAKILAAVALAPLPVVFPVHPRTRQRMESFGLSLPENVRPVPPLGYFEFLRVLSRSAKVLTDSGGVQKQAFFLARPCITLRPNTEWAETVEAGWNVLVDDDREQILGAIRDFSPPGCPDLSAFGEGKSTGTIIDTLERVLRKD